jgi:hypothetical protein
MATVKHPPVTIPERTLRRLAEASLTETQLDRLNEQVVDLRRRLVDPNAPNAYLAGLQKERAALLAKHMPPRPPSDFARRQLDRVLLNIGDLLFPWSVLELPYMTDGIYQGPGSSDATGDLVTAGLYAGGLAYGGSPGGTLTENGGHERWWVRTWCNSAVFPPAPVTGRLYYRFAVDSECNIYRDPVQTGSIVEYVTLGTTGDISTAPPVDEWTDWRTVGWPINATLPLPGPTLVLEGNVLVSDSIAVNAGDSAAIAFIYGTIISVASGLLQLLWGNFGTRVVKAGQTVDYRDYDKIEYRFEPDWWLEAVSNRLANAPPAG